MDSQIRSVVDESGSSSSIGIKHISLSSDDSRKKESLKCYSPIHTHFASKRRGFFDLFFFKYIKCYYLLLYAKL
jgi:hypothetical protein